MFDTYIKNSNYDYLCASRLIKSSIIIIDIDVYTFALYYYIANIYMFVIHLTSYVYLCC